MAWYNTIGIGGGNGPGPGEQMWAQYYEQQRQLAAQKAAEDADIAKGTAARETAVPLARQQAMKYFTDRGLNADDYSGDIDARIQELLGTVDAKDTAPGQYLQNIGQYIGDTKRNAMRERATGDVNRTFGQTTARDRINDTFDDPYINEADAAQRGTADEYIQRLLKRGVITATGAGGAENYLSGQGARVRTQLNDIGQGILSSGRDKLNSIIGGAKANAGALDLGQTFDVNRYGSDLDQAYNDFSSKFGDTFKGSVPEGLYDTSGVTTAAGLASGAQNTVFDPFAIANKPNPNQVTETDPTKQYKNTAAF